MTDDTAFLRLAEALGSRVRRDVALAPYTAMRVGGPADLLAVVDSAEELVRAVRLARQHVIPCRVLGCGCNVLISDEGVPGLVVVNRANSVSFSSQTVQAESGAKLAVVADMAVSSGLAGLSWASGLPGTVGGAVVSNAGAYGGDVAGTLRSARILQPNGEVHERPQSWFEFRYRGSRLKAIAGDRRYAGLGTDDQGGQAGARGSVVLDVVFEMHWSDALALRARADEVLAHRRAHHPSGATMGCTFKNPPGDHAGRLIERAGLKGYRVGGARISEKHGNFFVNTGQATARDVLELIEHARAEVARYFGVTLELEIELLGWNGTHCPDGQWPGHDRTEARAR